MLHVPNIKIYSSVHDCPRASFFVSNDPSGLRASFGPGDLWFCPRGKGRRACQDMYKMDDTTTRSSASRLIPCTTSSLLDKFSSTRFDVYVNP